MREEGGVLKLAVRVGRRVEHDSRPLFFPSNQLTSAINCWRQTLCFKPKSVGLESAPFIRSVNKLPAADRDLLGNAHCVCPQLILYTTPIDTEALGHWTCKYHFARTIFETLILFFI